MTTSYGQLQAGSGFYAVGKDMLRAFGVTKAMFIAVLADIDDYSTLQGNERFFATREVLKQKTGYAEMTIKKLLKELKSEGILDDGLKGEGLDNRKFYKIDYERLGEIVKNTLNEPICVRAKNSPDDRAKNSPNQRAKFTPNLHITTNLNLQTQIEQKEGEQKIETPRSEIQTSQKTKMLKDQKEILDILAKEVDKLPNKPKGDFELFRAWILKKVAKNKGITEFTIAKNVKEYAKLDFLANESPDDRLVRAYESGWSGIVFKDDKFIAGGYQAPQIQHDHKHNNANFDKNIRALNESVDTREFMTIDEYAKQSKGD